MSDSTLSPYHSPRSIRLWPAVVIVAIQWFLRFILPIIYPEGLLFSVMGSLACGPLLLIWWLFFSRVRWSERIGGIALVVAIMWLASLFLHESVSTAAMGLMYAMFAVPTVSLAFVLWAGWVRRRSEGPRWASMAAAIAIGSGMWLLFRTGGFDSAGDHELAWRWSSTAEDRLLESAEMVSGNASIDTDGNSDILWSGFRGLDRNGKVNDLAIETDWAASPPLELWRRQVGPGWSSFAVLGNLFFTQEQRGEEEVVASYNLISGEPVWVHSDPVRFWEANAGAGPRATPLVHEGKVYALGATGILNALNATDGSVIWSRNTLEDTGAKVPGWGIAGSPLIVGNQVFVATAGTLAAYDLQSGDLSWKGPDGKDGYSSPHRVKIDGIEQVILMSRAGAVSLAADDGSLLWNYERAGGSRIVQPAQIENGELLMSRGETSGLSRVTVGNQDGNWTVEEQWTTNRFKPYFSDFVVHEGHIYGFDGNRLVSVTLEDAKHNWKGGRYGSGQLLLLADQDLLLVVSEQGELALVEAKPETFVELATLPALEGKTWNHPVIANGILLVRNDREMAAFKLNVRDS